MKILAIDIETRPAMAYVWKAWDENVTPEQVIDPGGVISFAAKWIGEGKVEFRSDFHDGHSIMIERVHELLSEADVVLHFNGRRFDVPWLNREFVEARLLPPAPFKQIDLLTTVKDRFRFLMNRLAHVSVQLGFEGKIEHEGFALWKKCAPPSDEENYPDRKGLGDEKAWGRMKKYNIRDTLLLEDIYIDVLRPWIKTHPSMSASKDLDMACPRCGGTHYQARGYTVLVTGKFQRFQCRGCGGWFRSNKRVGGTSAVAIND